MTKIQAIRERVEKALNASDHLALAAVLQIILRADIPALISEIDRLNAVVAGIVAWHEQQISRLSAEEESLFSCGGAILLALAQTRAHIATHKVSIKHIQTALKSSTTSQSDGDVK